MATFITVDYEKARLLELNKLQVDANRLRAEEALELNDWRGVLKRSTATQKRSYLAGPCGAAGERSWPRFLGERLK